ncbi:MAG: hypothetical protein WBA74_19065 [Cyclobacteriaceae bacterium]
MKNPQLLRTVMILLLYTCLAIGCSSPQLTKSGSRKLENGKLLKARAKLFKAIAKDDRYAPAYYYLAKVDKERGYYNSALRNINKAESLGFLTDVKNQRSDIYFYLAKQSYENEELENARTFLSYSLSDKPNNKKSQLLFTKNEVKRMRDFLDNNLPKAALSLINGMIKEEPYGFSDVRNQVYNMQPEAYIKSIYQLIMQNGDPYDYINLVLSKNDYYFKRYHATAIQYRGLAYLRDSRYWLKQGNKYKALDMVQKALRDMPKNILAKYHRANVLFVFAQDYYKQGDLDKALKNLNSSIWDGNDSTIAKSKKLRSKVNLAIAKTKTTLEDQIKYATYSINDDNNNEETRYYLSELYILDASKKINSSQPFDAKEPLRLASYYNEKHKDVYELMKRAERTPWGSEYFLDLTKAELLASNLKLRDAIKLVSLVGKEKSFKAEASYNQARYFALKGDINSSLNILRTFLKDPVLFEDYHKYREKAAIESDFHNIRVNDEFQSWIDAIRNIKITLKGYYNMPNDRGEIGKVDPKLVFSHNGTQLLTTRVYDESPSKKFEKDQYVAIFKYDYSKPIDIEVLDDDPLRWETLLSGSYENVRFDNYNLYFTDSPQSYINIVFEDAHGQRQGSTYNYISNWLLTYKNRYAVRKLYPFNEQSKFYQANNVQQYDVLSVAYKLAPCAGELGVNLLTKNFLLRQLAYYVIVYYFDQDLSIKKAGGKALVDFLVDKIDHPLVATAETIVSFCGCAAEAFE